MDVERQKRKANIKRALVFMKSSLPFPEPESFKMFVTQLVCNLLEEGNATFREGNWKQAVWHYTEGISVLNYAIEEEASVPSVLLESLTLNRGAARYSMGEYERGLQDYEQVLSLNKDSQKALYRKALCLRQLGRHREAYDCLPSSTQDKHMKELSQELACKLGLKSQTSYYTSMDGLPEGTNGIFASATKEESSDLKVSFNGLNSLEEISAVRLSLGIPIPVSDVSSHPPPTAAAKHTLTQQFPHSSSALSPEACVPPLSIPVSGDALATCEVLGDELDSLLDACEPLVVEQQPSLMGNHLPDKAPGRLPPAFPSPAPQLPSRYFGGALGGQPHSLDYLCELGPDHLTPSRGLDALDALDALDSFCPLGAPAHTSIGPALPVGGKGLDSLSEFTLPSTKESHIFLSSVRAPNHLKTTNGKVPPRNPLQATHEFRQACTICFVKNGSSVVNYEYRPDQAHECKGTTLLCRRKGAGDATWKKIRPRPPRNDFVGPYVLCKEVQEHQDCKYGENCTFAYYQEEIDVWMQERTGFLIRELLFGPLTSASRHTLTVTDLLQVHSGMFMFLCGACFDSKPRVISKRCREKMTVCLNAHHLFDHNKCMVHVEKLPSNTKAIHDHEQFKTQPTEFLKSNQMVRYRYTKIRVLWPACQFEMCRQEMRHGCRAEGSCPLAHSVIELKCWMLQHTSGSTHEEMVQESIRHWNRQEQSPRRQKPSRTLAANRDDSPPTANGGCATGSAGATGGARGRSLNMEMKFVCGQCWRDGVVSEPDRALKYCMAKARHSWIRERQVLLVKAYDKQKWVMVRSPPKNPPQKYDICIHVVNQRKCQYIGNCSFAHSQEEKDLWTYMRNEGLQEMLQMYEMWLAMTNQSQQPVDPPVHQHNDNRHIPMPTDYAEPMSGFHCRLCGKHSNGERQWQQHISTEKHKDRLFSCEEDEETLDWIHRFPGLHFALCPRLDGVCPEGLACDFAHSEEELQEWHERRAFMRQKLAKARADMLIAPTDFNFGKYNFLLRD
ncbi:zinc finger CCCH-type containing 7Ba isoform X2 [Engraulis encrasicolus]|uniref:zinc finger CCCH-type containing 7Ba isoform X2 n=1 Tax=Engraulis encrasicolus TaxID=184585 RepID=UPI002FD168A3